MARTKPVSRLSLGSLRLWQRSSLNPNSHELLAGGSDGRRRFLDWGVFHVEQGFGALWSRYQRAFAANGMHAVETHQLWQPARARQPWDLTSSASLPCRMLGAARNEVSSQRIPASAVLRFVVPTPRHRSLVEPLSSVCFDGWTGEGSLAEEPGGFSLSAIGIMRWVTPVERPASEQTGR